MIQKLKRLVYTASMVSCLVNLTGCVSMRDMDARRYELNRKAGVVVSWGVSGYDPVKVPGDLTNVVAVAAGPYHNVAIKTDGTVAVWGNPMMLWSGYPIPSGLDHVTAVSAGTCFSLALKEDGTVVAWGINESGQCAVPDGLSDVVSVAAGYRHSLAVKSDGTVVPWGFNRDKQCDVPEGLKNAVAVAGGVYHSLALRSDGTVVGWGGNWTKQCDVPEGLSGVVQIAAGIEHSLALKSDGTVVAWGGNRYGECDVPEGLTNVVGISTCESSCLALKADGNLIGWGVNGDGQCDVPVGLTPVTALAMGRTHSVVVTKPRVPDMIRQPESTVAHVGQTVCLDIGVFSAIPYTVEWFRNDSGQLVGKGHGLVLRDFRDGGFRECYAVVENAIGAVTSKVVSVAVGRSPRTAFVPCRLSSVPVVGRPLSLTALVDYGEKPFSVGWYKDGALVHVTDGVNWTINPLSEQDSGIYSLVVSNDFGVATSRTFRVSAVVPGIVVAWGNNGRGRCEVPEGLNDVVAVAAGVEHSLALRANGTVVSWGGEAGDRGSQVVPEGLTHVVAIACRGNANVAVKSDGTVVGWGRSARGTPDLIPELEDVVDISGSYALKSDGMLVDWSQTDNGRTDAQNKIRHGLTNLIAIAVGERHRIALKSDGTVVGWGHNQYGQCNSPAALADVAAIAAGENYSLAVTAEGLVVAWGGHFDGQGQCNVPRGLNHVVSVAAGKNHSLALKSDGTVAAWGYNETHQCDVPHGLKNAIAIAAGESHSLAVVSD